MLRKRDTQTISWGVDHLSPLIVSFFPPWFIIIHCFLSSFPLLLLLPIITSPFQVSSLLYYPMSLLHFSFIVSSSSLSAPMTVIGRPSFFHFLQHSVLASSPLASPSFLFSLCFLSFINLFSFCFLLLSPCQFTPFFTISLLPFLLYRLVFLLHCLISFVIFSILSCFPIHSHLSVLCLLYILSFTILCPCFLSFSVFICFLVWFHFLFSFPLLISFLCCLLVSSPLLSTLSWSIPFPSLSEDKNAPETHYSELSP